MHDNFHLFLIIALESSASSIYLSDFYKFYFTESPSS